MISAGAIIRVISGNMVRLEKVSSSTSAWAAIAKGRSYSSATSTVYSRLTDTKFTTRLAGRASFMRRVLLMRVENTLTRSRLTRRMPSRRALLRSWMSCSQFAIDREAREKQMSHAERHALRLERAPEQLDKLRAQLLTIRRHTKGRAGHMT